MSVRLKIPFNCGTFFITFTNVRWIPLFELTASYDLVFKFFDTLRLNGHFINAYVIMPNHVHLILTFTKTNKSINTIIGTGKRMIAYGIVRRLEEQKQAEILKKLETLVSPRDQRKNQKHEVFEPSFDWKHLDNEAILQQKLDYIHANPVVSSPALATDPGLYPYSSAGFYSGSGLNIYPVDHILAMNDVNLENPSLSRYIAPKITESWKVAPWV